MPSILTSITLSPLCIDLGQAMTSPSPFQLNIPRRNPKCADCEQELEAGARYHSVVLTDVEPTERRDFCSDCWSRVADEYKLSATWRGTIPKKAETPHHSLSQEERALDLLQELLPASTPEAREEAFVLGLFLARQRRLVLRSEVTEGQEALLLYEELASGETVRIPKVDVTALRIETLQETLAKKMA